MSKTNYRLFSAFLFLTLVLPLLFCACQSKESGKNGEGKSSANKEQVVSPLPAKNKSVVIWTGLDPLSMMGRAFERLITISNGKNKPLWGTLEYFAPKDFPARALDGANAELPPDLLIVPSTLAREMCEKRVTLPIDQNILREMKIDRADIFEAAWKSVTNEKGELCALPLCGEMRLRYMNLDKMKELGLTTKTLSSSSSPSMGEKEGWDRFVKGEIPSCEASSDQLRLLFRAKPAFAWRAEPLAGSYRTLALAIRAKGEVPPSGLIPLLQISLDPGFGSLLWTECSRLPIHPPQRTPDRAKSFQDIQPWLEEWMRVGE